LLQNLGLKKLLASLVLCFGAAAIGSMVTRPAVASWYVTVQKPVFSPPNEVFAPVWTILYLLMAVALYLVWHKRENGVRDNLALQLFAVQLTLNVFWSVVFFGLHSIGGGLIVICLLGMTLLATIRRFGSISRFAAACLIPYFLWLSFATVLNFAIWRLNP
jgi:tryptophan-rich sensory protein